LSAGLVASWQALSGYGRVRITKSKYLIFSIKSIELLDCIDLPIVGDELRLLCRLAALGGDWLQ